MITNTRSAKDVPYQPLQSHDENEASRQEAVGTHAVAVDFPPVIKPLNSTESTVSNSNSNSNSNSTVAPARSASAPHVEQLSASKSKLLSLQVRSLKENDKLFKLLIQYNDLLRQNEDILTADELKEANELETRLHDFRMKAFKFCVGLEMKYKMLSPEKFYRFVIEQDFAEELKGYEKEAGTLWTAVKNTSNKLKDSHKSELKKSRLFSILSTACCALVITGAIASVVGGALLAAGLGVGFHILLSGGVSTFGFLGVGYFAKRHLRNKFQKLMATMDELAKETSRIQQQIITVSEGIKVCTPVTETIPNLEPLFEAIVALKNSVAY